MQRGDKVSVYADIDEKCLRGFTQTYQGDKMFVGNGVAQISRAELFAGNNKPRFGCKLCIEFLPVFDPFLCNYGSYLIERNLENRKITKKETFFSFCLLKKRERIFFVSKRGNVILLHFEGFLLFCTFVKKL